MSVPPGDLGQEDTRSLMSRRSGGKWGSVRCLRSGTSACSAVMASLIGGSGFSHGSRMVTV